MTKTIYLVTGNKGKLTEWQRLFPKTIALESIDIDLTEIQSDSLGEIALDKAKRAFKKVGKPVLVEDVAVGIDRLNGMPGPYIKYFEIAMGFDALHQLTIQDKEPGSALCTIAYYDGTSTIVVIGETKGYIVAARGDGGFGFDKCFMPKGSNKTYGEMTAKEKDAVSHRRKALEKLVPKLAKVLQ